MRNESVIVKRPSWVSVITDGEILKISEDNDQIKALRLEGKYISYLDKNILHTTNSKTEDYVFKIWSLDTSELLQGASVLEMKIKDNEDINLYRIAVIRDGNIIDKKDSLVVRKLDDEVGSSSGSIQRTKKINCIINGLEIRDILILEYGKITSFGAENEIDKKYLQYIKTLPFNSYWFYKGYFFEIIQNRSEDLLVVNRYVKDENGENVKGEKELSSGSNYKFEKHNFQFNYRDDVYAPYLEIATKATWSQISTYLSNLYSKEIEEVDIKNNKAYQSLNLDDKEVTMDIKIERIIEFVQNNIVYLYDADVMHRHIPQSIEKTMESKSGDCKAKSLLLINLLHTLNIKSDFALVSPQMDQFIDKSLPSPFLFNHVIVRISYNNKYYFVDPTLSNCFGTLENRSEPFISSYLVISENSNLDSKPLHSISDYNIEEEVSIDLKKDSGTIKIKSLYRRESADAVRNLFRLHSLEQIIDAKNKEIIVCLGSIGKNLDDVFRNVQHKIVKDEHEKNELEVSYEAVLIEPYQTIDKLKVFKFYHTLNSKEIQDFKFKDGECSSFCSYPTRDTIIIKSEFPVVKTKVLKTGIEIDNDYFYFSNKKEFYSKLVKVVSEFRPKHYGYIKSEDLEAVKKDYLKINESNFGVGIVCGSAWYYTKMYWYPIVLLVIYILSRIFNNM